VSRIIGHRSFGKRVSRSLKRFWTRAPKPRLLLRQFLDHAARFPRENRRFSTLGQAPGQFLLDSAEPAWIIRCGCRYFIRCLRDCARQSHRFGARIAGFIVCGDWARALRGRFDVIVSNPPMSRAAQSLAWNRRFANMIRVWPSMEGRRFGGLSRIIPALPDCWHLAV